MPVTVSDGFSSDDHFGSIALGRERAAAVRLAVNVGTLEFATGVPTIAFAVALLTGIDKAIATKAGRASGQRGVDSSDKFINSHFPVLISAERFATGRVIRA